MIHQKRRQILLNQLGDNALVVISTNPEQLRNGDVYYPFRPDSSFWYLSGFTEPGAVAVFSSVDYTIFLREKDPLKTIWDGERLGTKAATDTLLSDNAFDISNLQTELKKRIKNASSVYFDPKPCPLDNAISKTLTATKPQPLAPYLAKMRLIKDQAEVTLIQRAVDVSIEAHQQAIKQIKAGIYEYQIAGIFASIFAKNNVQHAYPSIVAGGENGCTLHYINNDKPLKASELLLIDAGCEAQGYAADITRTLPIDGTFTPAQKQIYQLVLDAQSAAIEAIKPREYANKPHQIARQIISEGLLDLGILDDKKNSKNFFMHGTSHWLGLDVHDVGAYKNGGEHCRFKAGMVLTVEPGIYIRPSPKINEIYWNIGIRIEDNVLVTKSGNTVLTQALAKEISEIEYLMSQK